MRHSVNMAGGGNRAA